MEEAKTKQIDETINLYNRERIDISGAVEILSSTEKEVNVKLETDFMQIVGENLKIVKLIPDSKLLSLSGRISGLSFSGKSSKKSFLGRVFK